MGRLFPISLVTGEGKRLLHVGQESLSISSIARLPFLFQLLALLQLASLQNLAETVVSNDTVSRLIIPTNVQYTVYSHLNL